LKHEGTLALDVSRGKTDRIGDVIAQVWDAYYANDHRSVENRMASLRKLSPYHSRELYNELNELISAQE
jgi:hypothetical protein